MSLRRAPSESRTAMSCCRATHAPEQVRGFEHAITRTASAAPTRSHSKSLMRNESLLATGYALCTNPIRADPWTRVMYSLLRLSSAFRVSIVAPGRVAQTL
jgi:hypothetical protein